MSLLTRKREIKRAHVQRAYEIRLFVCLSFEITISLEQLTFHYLLTCKHCITHWQGIISGFKELFDTDSESRGIHVLKNRTKQNIDTQTSSGIVRTKTTGVWRGTSSEKDKCYIFSDLLRIFYITVSSEIRTLQLEHTKTKRRLSKWEAGAGEQLPADKS